MPAASEAPKASSGSDWKSAAKPSDGNGSKASAIEPGFERVIFTASVLVGYTVTVTVRREWSRIAC